MRISFLVVLLSFSSLLFSQEKNGKKPNIFDNLIGKDSLKANGQVAVIDMYRAITLDRDTTYIDTSLTIQNKYSHNYLRRDLFGLLAFSNEGQTYNTMQHNLHSFSPLPEFGFKAKHFNFLEANQIKYYSVATPVTELYFKSVMKKGQNVDAFITLNTSKQFNFSIAYKGLSSEGKYINQMSSSGNFRFTTSYHTKNKRYFANAHFTGQDLLNEENGGITTPEDFENGNKAYTQRDLLEVYLTDARSFLKGKRVFLNHLFRINAFESSNNLFIAHQFNYENKFFEYNQPTVLSNVAEKTVYRFGESYKTSDINDQTNYNKTYNKLGLTYENTTLGTFNFFVDDFFSNYFYNQILILDKGIVPATLNRRIDCYGGQYDYKKDKWTGKFLLSRSITNQSLSNLDAKMRYDLNDENWLSFQYQNINKLPNDNYNLFQSSYVNYNWSNDFKNEKINSIVADAHSLWVDIWVQYSVFNDHLYFDDVATAGQDVLRQQIVAPMQYANTINYFSVKASNEFRFGKFALDNTLLYQKVDQSNIVLNVPEFLTRNTFYYSQNLFHKALFFQTGITFNYFTKYYSNEYNPVIGEFFVQNKKEIGNFANFDFFFNARVQRTRFYLTLEHFNSSLTGYQFYSSPNNPTGDFIIRFGLVWNFFQ
jgi:hypothetical protein